MKALSIFGQALLAFVLAVAYVVWWIVCLPFLIAYYVVVAVFTVVTFTVCAILVMVYKFAAWLARLGK